MSMDWYKKQIRQLGLTQTSAQDLLRGRQGSFSSAISVGSMYLYAYDAKHKATLPYWDMFPLVFPFAETSDGFYGINLHYIPQMARGSLIKKLMVAHASGREVTATTRLRLSWKVLSGYAEAIPCVKRYLYAQVKSRFMEIHPGDWQTASFLPLQQFVGASDYAVYNRARSKK